LGRWFSGGGCSAEVAEQKAGNQAGQVFVHGIFRLIGNRFPTFQGVGRESKKLDAVVSMVGCWQIGAGFAVLVNADLVEVGAMFLGGHFEMRDFGASGRKTAISGSPAPPPKKC
jgi:hypothetical protein